MNINLNLKIKKIEIKGDNILNLPDQNQSTNHYNNNSNKETLAAAITEAAMYRK